MFWIKGLFLFTYSPGLEQLSGWPPARMQLFQDWRELEWSSKHQQETRGKSVHSGKKFCDKVWPPSLGDSYFKHPEDKGKWFSSIYLESTFFNLAGVGNSQLLTKFCRFTRQDVVKNRLKWMLSHEVLEILLHILLHNTGNIPANGPRNIRGRRIEAFQA